MEQHILIAGTAIWVGAVVIWLLFCEKRLSSPLFLYLVFHCLSFVVRPWVIERSGDQSYLRNWIGIWPTTADHSRALWVANLGLILFTAGTLVGEWAARRKGPPASARVIGNGVLAGVGTVTLLVGALSYLRYAVTPWSEGLQTAEILRGQEGYAIVTTSSAYLTGLHIVIVGVLLMWAAFWGVKWFMVPLAAVYFVAVIYSGVGRTTYLLGILSLILIVTTRRGRRWPAWQSGFVLAAVLLAFVGGKLWLQVLHNEGVGATRALVTEKEYSNFKGNGDLFLNYDFLVGVTYLVPQHAEHTELALYLRQLYFWVPRAIWPDKPISDFGSAYIMSHVPEVSFQGLTVTLVGESYMAFGLSSVVILMFVYGVVFSYVHGRTIHYPAASVERIFGIAFTVTLVQTYRDGIGFSFLLFMLFYFGPCLLCWGMANLVGQVRRIPLAPAELALPRSLAPAPRPAPLPIPRPAPAARAGGGPARAEPRGLGARARAASQQQVYARAPQPLRDTGDVSPDVSLGRRS